MHRLVGPLVAALLVTVAGGVARGRPPGMPSKAPLPADALVAEGSGKLEAGDVDGALAAFRQAEALGPKDPRPRYLRGAALAKKDPEAAIAAYREALALDGALAAVHGELGALLLDRGRLDEALIELKAALKFDPALVDAWSNIARLEGRRGRSEAAMSAWREAEKLAPRDVDLRIDHSLALRKAGRNDDALRLAREAVSLDGGSAPAQLSLGFAFQAGGKLDEAVAAFTVAARIAPKDAGAHWALGVAERERKHLPEAIAALRRAMELKPTPAIAEELGLALVADKKVEVAVELITTARTKHPRSIAFRLAEARVLLAAGRCDAARGAIADLPPTEPAVRAVAESAAKACHAPTAKAPAPARKSGGATRK